MNTFTVRITPETTKLLTECRRVCVEHHPEMEGFKITYDKIIKHIAKYYIEN